MTAAQKDAIQQVIHLLRDLNIASLVLNGLIAADLDIHPVELQCLNLLTLIDGEIDAHHLAAKLSLQTEQVTKLIFKLEKRGFVRTDQIMTDSRTTAISLDDACKKDLDVLYGFRQAPLEDILAAYPTSSCERFITLLAKANALLRDEIDSFIALR